MNKDEAVDILDLLKKSLHNGMLTDAIKLREEREQALTLAIATLKRIEVEKIETILETPILKLNWRRG